MFSTRPDFGCNIYIPRAYVDSLFYKITKEKEGDKNVSLLVPLTLRAGSAGGKTD
jgi:hypothetical protein